PSQVDRQGGDDWPEAAALAPSRQLSDPRFAARQRLGGDLSSIGRLAPREAEPQKTAMLGSVDGALLPVHLQLEPLRNEAEGAGHDPPHGPCATHIDVAIVAVTTEPESPRLQFLIQFV